jgi:hypothetical protein
MLPLYMIHPGFQVRERERPRGASPGGVRAAVAHAVTARAAAPGSSRAYSALPSTSAMSAMRRTTPLEASIQ